MSMVVVVCASLAVAAVSVVLFLLGLRVGIGRMDDWADRMIGSFFGSPEELLRRLQEREER